MNFVSRAYSAVAAFLKAYPGGTAGVLTAVVALAATFGFKVNVTELAAIVSAVSVVAGVIVHITTKNTTLPNLTLHPLPDGAPAPVGMPTQFPVLGPVADEAPAPVAVAEAVAPEVEQAAEAVAPVA